MKMKIQKLYNFKFPKIFFIFFPSLYIFFLIANLYFLFGGGIGMIFNETYNGRNDIIYNNDN